MYLFISIKCSAVAGLVIKLPNNLEPKINLIVLPKPKAAAVAHAANPPP